MGALPWLGLGLGVMQLGQSQRAMDMATAGLSPEQREQARRQGTSNIGANLSERGLLDSSLYTGGLAGLEKQIAEARNPNADLLWQQAMGLGQGGAQTISNLAQMYMLNKLLGNTPGFGAGQFTGNPNAPWEFSQYGTTSPPWFNWR